VAQAGNEIGKIDGDHRLVLDDEDIGRHLLGDLGGRLIDERLQPVPGSADAGVAAEVIYRAVDGMLAELQPNLWEDRLHRCVDYGHSFSPLITAAEDARPLSPMAGRGRLGDPRRWSSWGNRVGRVIGKSVTHQA
jgi:hypothetical protein